MSQRQSGISRREFALRAALASAAGALAPIDSVLSAHSAHSVPPRGSSQESAEALTLSSESRAEADARYESIVKEYGHRFSGDQKKDLRRLSHSLQAQLDRLRVFSVQNSDSPALYLKPIVEREKKPAAVVPALRNP